MSAVELQINAGIVRESVFMETFLDEEEVGGGAGVKTAGLKCR